MVVVALWKIRELVSGEHAEIDWRAERVVGVEALTCCGHWGWRRKGGLCRGRRLCAALCALWRRGSFASAASEDTSTAASATSTTATSSHCLSVGVVRGCVRDRVVWRIRRLNRWRCLYRMKC